MTNPRLRDRMRSLIVLALLSLVSCGEAPISPRQLEIPIAEGEKWWIGVISRSHEMPVDASGEFSIDLYGNTAGNQVQPLLLSSAGRYIWSEQPFKIAVRDGTIRLSARDLEAKTGTSGSTLRDAYQYASENFFPPSGKTPDEVLFTHPQFNTWIELTYDQNEADVLKYARSIVEHRFPRGVLMIDEGWAERYGDWDFARSRFPDPVGMMRKLHDWDFQVMLWVCPYITPDGPFFAELSLDRDNTVWIRNLDRPEFPALLHWWNGFSAAADLSGPTGRGWLKRQLDALVATYGVDGFKFDGGDAEYYSSTGMLSPTLSAQEQITPNEHTEAFARLGLDYPLNEYRACWKMGGQPIAQRLRDKEHSWEDLRKLIPGIVNQGLMGYPFTCPDLIGGGEFLSFRNLEAVDQELIVRAAETHALMPMMQFSVAPWRVLDEANLAICRRMAELHAEMGPEILALAENAARTGEPIVRHMEYEYPHQGFDEIDDQFLVGDSILVAPVLEKGATRRIIQFPPGTWTGEDGTTVNGPQAVEVAAPVDRLPWYRKAE